jgi:hypothetical protein
MVRLLSEGDVFDGEVVERRPGVSFGPLSHLAGLGERLVRPVEVNSVVQKGTEGHDTTEIRPVTLGRCIQPENPLKPIKDDTPRGMAARRVGIGTFR